MKETTFKWSNYLKATPHNLQLLATSLKSILVVVASSAFITGNESLGFYILLSGAALDELGKFFGHVNDEAMKTVSVTFPEKLSDQVEIKEEVKTNDVT